MSEITTDFKPITSQDELDAIIKDRLKRERETTQKRFEGWLSPEEHAKALEDANKALDDYKKAHEGDEATIKDLTAKNKAYETATLKARIAHEVGLSFEWIDRISGDDENTIRKDAETLKKLVGTGAQPIPTKNTEAGEGIDSSTAAMRSVLKSIKQN